MTSDSPLVLRSTADLLAMVPFLLGFHPAESMVLLGFLDGQITFSARYDLPPPTTTDAVEVAAIIARQHVQVVTLIGYGSVDEVDPPLRLLVRAVNATRVRVHDAVRVTEGRWWSFLAHDLCCPIEGYPCPSEQSAIAAQATYLGLVALPSREALAAQVARVGGEARARMRAATERARERMLELLDKDRRAQRGGRWIRRAGRLAVREAESRYRSGQALTDDEVAWLGLTLTDSAVRAYAVDRIAPQEWRIQLWAQVLRQVEPAYAAEPACLLGLVSWLVGQGPLARVAVDRALLADPHHPMAMVLDDIFELGIDPRLFLEAMTSDAAASPALSPPAGSGPGGRAQGGSGPGGRAQGGSGPGGRAQEGSGPGGRAQGGSGAGGGARFGDGRRSADWRQR